MYILQSQYDNWQIGGVLVNDTEANIQAFGMDLANVN